jgi:hypothetical protein
VRVPEAEQTFDGVSELLGASGASIPAFHQSPCQNVCQHIHVHSNDALMFACMYVASKFQDLLNDPVTDDEIKWRETD